MRDETMLTHLWFGGGWLDFGEPQEYSDTYLYSSLKYGTRPGELNPFDEWWRSGGVRKNCDVTFRLGFGAIHKQIAITHQKGVLYANMWRPAMRSQDLDLAIDAALADIGEVLGELAFQYSLGPMPSLPEKAQIEKFIAERDLRK
ncbi:hypothetical protein [Lapillicoccus jejuensis]|uniref:hypothetical protein n=1 Tax=Lapillicoccus jejuensis TaxID=402171 RepID=UPI0011512C86|nr:hypothetical protein [Lapillicoccus jejuensis]